MHDGLDYYQINSSQDYSAISKHHKYSSNTELFQIFISIEWIGHSPMNVHNIFAEQSEVWLQAQIGHRPICATHFNIEQDYKVIEQGLAWKANYCD